SRLTKPFVNWKLSQHGNRQSKDRATCESRLLLADTRVHSWALKLPRFSGHLNNPGSRFRVEVCDDSADSVYPASLCTAVSDVRPWTSAQQRFCRLPGRSNSATSA